MTDQEFCRIYSAYYGDGIDKIGQLVQTTMDGEELKELIEFFIKELKTNKMEENEECCPNCDECENIHTNYDYYQKHRPIEDFLCNECGTYFKPKDQ